MVDIEKEGQQASAFQSNPNLLLSDSAKVETIPTLEIKADDVACKHAASVSSLNDDERFYLMSRGVNGKEAESLIVEGFAAELAQRLPQEAMQEKLTEVLAGMSRNS